jgi:hypothetical protein
MIPCPLLVLQCDTCLLEDVMRVEKQKIWREFFEDLMSRISHQKSSTFNSTCTTIEHPTPTTLFSIYNFNCKYFCSCLQASTVLIRKVFFFICRVRKTAKLEVDNVYREVFPSWWKGTKELTALIVLVYTVCFIQDKQIFIIMCSRSNIATRENTQKILPFRTIDRCLNCLNKPVPFVCLESFHKNRIYIETS